jgi:cytochrome c peroxidase
MCTGRIRRSTVISSFALLGLWFAEEGILLSVEPSHVANWSAPPYFPRVQVRDESPIADSKIMLGRELFFDRRLSSDGTISCSSCHQPSRGYADSRAMSLGVEGREGSIHSPSLLNVAYSPYLFWNGRSQSLESQVRYPLTLPH